MLCFVVWLQNCYDAVKEEIDKFVEDSRWIAIGIAIGVCVIEVSTVHQCVV